MPTPILSDYTTRDGLLYDSDGVVKLPKADNLAATLGFNSAEEMVRALEKQQAAPRASQLVDALWELNRQRNHLECEIAQLTEALIATGPGKHSGDDSEHVLTVVGAGEPGVKYVHLDEDGAKKAREICGESFSDIFEREVAYKPRTGFLDRLDTALAAAAKRKLLALVEQPKPAKKAYILGLPKPAKK